MNFAKRRGITGLIILLALWQIFSLILSPQVFPGPVRTVIGLVREIGSGLFLHMGASLLRIFAALSISVLAGLISGLAAGRSSAADRILSPPAYLLYPLPKIAFLPVLMIFFGLGNLSKIAMVVLVIVLQVFIAVRDSVHRIPSEYFLSAASLGFDKPALYRHLILPAILPNLFSTLRISLGISFSVLFFAENYAAKWGIGYVIMEAWAQIDYVRMFAGILALGLCGFALFKLTDLLESKLCKKAPIVSLK